MHGQYFSIEEARENRETNEIIVSDNQGQTFYCVLPEMFTNSLSPLGYEQYN